MPTIPPEEEIQEFDPTELFNKYGGQHANQEYLAAVEAAGYEAQFISGKVPTTQFGGNVLADVTHGGSPEGIYQLRTGELEQKSYAERSALAAEGTSTQRYSYWDERGVTVHAPAGYHFETYANGAVRAVRGLIRKGTTAANAASPTRTSLFDQPAELQAPGTYEGKEFKQETLGYEPIAGKEIAETGQTVFNPNTKVDEYAGEGEVLIRYTDNTVERRKVGGAPGEAVPIDQFGRTPEELGLTPEGEAQTDNSGLEYIGKSYVASEGAKKGKTRTAPEGQAYYQDPSTRKILLRPDTGKENALPTTSPSILAARNDVTSMFQAVYGRAPSQQELAYWKGRTDKSGAALIGAMQFAKAEGKTIGGIPTGQSGGDPIAAIDNAIAASGDSDFAKLTAAAGTTIDLSKSASLVEKLTQMLTEKPSVPSLRDEYQKELLRSGFNEDAAELGEAERAIKQLDADFMSTLEGEEARRVSVGQIRRRQSTQEIAYNRIRRDMVVERDYLANKVAGKQAIVNTMVNLLGQDIANAQAEYQNRFQNAMAVTNLVRQVEQDQLTQLQRQQDNARANVQVMSQLLASGNINYNSLDSSTRSQLKSMELQAGLPVGFTQFVSETVKDPEVQFLPAYTDINGVRIQPIATINPSTGAYTIKNVNQGKVDLPAGYRSTPKLTTAQKEGQKFLEDSQGLQEKMIGGDYNWQQAWDTLKVRYPSASIETIDNALGTSFRDKYNK